MIALNDAKANKALGGIVACNVMTQEEAQEIRRRGGVIWHVMGTPSESVPMERDDPKWKGTVRSLVACQLVPRVGSLNLQQIEHDALDKRLIWPMQEVHSLPYTRQAFGLLKTAFKRATKLKMLSVNPLA